MMCSTLKRTNVYESCRTLPSLKLQQWKFSSSWFHAIFYTHPLLTIRNTIKLEPKSLLMDLTKIFIKINLLKKRKLFVHISICHQWYCTNTPLCLFYCSGSSAGASSLNSLQLQVITSQFNIYFSYIQWYSKSKPYKYLNLWCWKWYAEYR